MAEVFGEYVVKVSADGKSIDAMNTQIEKGIKEPKNRALFTLY